MPLPYYKRFPRDFLEGTVGLSLEEKGAYGIVIDLIFMRDGRLEDDARYIAGQLGCSVRKWSQIRAALIERDKIQVVAGIISNLRANYLIEEQRSYQDKQAENASRPKKIKDLPEPPLKPKASQSEPEPDKIPSSPPSAGEPVDWNARLEAARLIAGPSLDPTAIACHHYRDLKALCEPVSGEPCEWGEVLDAIRMVGERQAQRGKPLRTWAWVRDDALALRDKRLQGNPEPVVVAFQPKSQYPPNSTGWRDQERIAAENWEASRKLLFPKETVP